MLSVLFFVVVLSLPLFVFSLISKNMHTPVKNMNRVAISFYQFTQPESFFPLSHRFSFYWPIKGWWFWNVFVRKMKLL